MKRVWLLASTLAFSSACAARRPEIAAVRQEVERRASLPVRWDQGTEADEEVQKRIRELLAAQLTVDAAVEVALLNNRSLQATYERLGVAQADVVEAGLLQNPVLGGSLRYPDRGPRIARPEFSIAQEFLSLFMLPLRKKLARAEFEQQKLLVADAVFDLAAEVKASWFEAQGAEQIARLRRTVAEGAAAAAEVARRLHDAGNISDLRLALDEDAGEQAKLEILGADAEIVATRERLNRLLGLWGNDIGWKLPEELAPLPEREPALEHLESLAIAQRLDLSAERQEVAVLQRAAALTNSWRWFPALELGFVAEREDNGVTLLGPSIGFQLPIFNQGQASRLRLESQMRRSQNTLAANAIEVRSEVREGRDRMLRLRKQAELYRDTLIPMRERIVLLSQQQFNAMLLGVFDLLRAKQNEVDTYRGYLEALRDYWVARADLEHAVGGSLAPPKPEGENK